MSSYRDERQRLIASAFLHLLIQKPRDSTHIEMKRMHGRIKPCCQHKYDGAAYQNAFVYICAIPYCNMGSVYSLTVFISACRSWCHSKAFNWSLLLRHIYLFGFLVIQQKDGQCVVHYRKLTYSFAALSFSFEVPAAHLSIHGRPV